MTTIFPLDNYVLVYPESKETITSSGIKIVDSRVEEYTVGRIAATGPKSKLNIGQKVLYITILGQHIVHESTDKFILHDNFILGVFNEDR